MNTYHDAGDHHEVGNALAFSGIQSDSLSREELMLISLRDELYQGSWDCMVRDLKSRLEGKKYIFKLANRIEDDLARIEKLRAIEARPW